MAWLLGLCLVAAFSTASRAEDAGAVRPANHSSEDAPAVFQPVIYIPPPRGAPDRRVGGGTRGIHGMHLQVLAPSHTGFTARPSPTLYWFLEGDLNRPLEFTIAPESAELPLVRHRLHPPFEPGIQSIALADIPLELEPGVEYRWSIREPTPTGSAELGAVRASGAIQRLSAEELPALSEVAQDVITQVRTLSAHGLWYDALEAVSEQQRKQSNPHLWNTLRLDLLEQVGLQEVVESAAAGHLVMP